MVTNNEEAALLDKLEALAREAAEGNRAVEVIPYGPGIGRRVFTDRIEVKVGMSLIACAHATNWSMNGKRDMANMDLIAALDPATVLQLIALARRSTSGSEPEKCEDCDGRGHDNDFQWQGHFQPPEPGICNSCGGSGKAEASESDVTAAANPWPFCAHDGTCSCAKFHDNPEGCERRTERGIQPDNVATSGSDQRTKFDFGEHVRSCVESGTTPMTFSEFKASGSDETQSVKVDERTLPPLPAPDVHTGDEAFGDNVSSFSGAAMRDYARAALAAPSAGCGCQQGQCCPICDPMIKEP